MENVITTPSRSTYDPEAKALHLAINDRKVASTKQLAYDVIVDYDKEGEIVGIEILDIADKLNSFH
jgi:uncharacterized protein YuzE